MQKKPSLVENTFVIALFLKNNKTPQQKLLFSFRNTTKNMSTIFLYSYRILKMKRLKEKKNEGKIRNTRKENSTKVGNLFYNHLILIEVKKNN